MGRSPHRATADTPEVLTRQAIMALMRTADGARRAMTQALAPFDLTLPQFNVLTILRFTGELPTFQVAARMVEAAPGITRLVSTLDGKGLVRRAQSSSDRRQQLCALTPKGRRVVDAAIPRVAEAQARLVGTLSRADVLQLRRLLQRITPGQPAS